MAKANTTVSPRLVPFLWSTVGAAVIVFISAFLPWVSYTGGSVSGTAGDGVITLLLALVTGGLAAATIFLAAKAPILPKVSGIVAIVAGVIVTLVAVIDISNVGDTRVSGLGVFYGFSVGFGLWLTLVGGIAFVVLGILATLTARRN